MKQVKSTQRFYLSVNVILTFNSPNSYGDAQEFFDVKLPISKYESSAVAFVNNKLFKRIVKKCEQYGRRADDLVKISTASNWNLFEEATSLPSLATLGHNCKWYFGNGRDDLDGWEEYLMLQYGFGTSVDMSWVNSAEIQNHLIAATATQQQPSSCRQ